MTPKGNCYQNSARTLLHDTFFENALLIHAVWYRKLGRLYVPTVCTYNKQQLQAMLDEHQTWGPWDEFICKVGEQEPMKHDDFLKFSNNTFLFPLDG